MCLEEMSKLGRRINFIIHTETALGSIESRHVFSAHSYDWDALCLEIFESQAYIQDGFTSCADDHDRCLCKFFKIRAYIHCDFSSSVDSADASGRKDTDACHVSDHHGSSYCAGSVFTLSAEHCKVTPRSFCDFRAFLSKILYFFRGKPGLETSSDYCDGCRYCAVISYDLLYSESCLYVLRIWHSV